MDLVIDVSRSMAVTDVKLRAHGELSALLACACASTVADSRVITTPAGDPQPLVRTRGHRTRRSPASDRCRRSKGRTCRCAADRCASSSATFCFRTIPMRWSRVSRATARRWPSCSSRCARKRSPVPKAADGCRRRGPRRAGSGASTRRAVRDYRARFSRLRLGLSGAARRVGARFAHVSAGTPVRDVARALAAAGVLEAA